MKEHERKQKTRRERTNKTEKIQNGVIKQNSVKERSHFLNQLGGRDV